MAANKYEPRVKVRQHDVSKRFVVDPFLNFVKPSAYIDSVKDINTFALKEQGKKLIICDLDNTLVPHFTKYPTKLAFDFVERAHEAGLNFIIFSNNTSKRVSFFAEKLGVENYVSGAKKPFPKKLKKIMEEMNVSPKETVLVGDMIITDMLVANLMDADSILVRPIIDPEKA
jgi:hypothetical protein